MTDRYGVPASIVEGWEEYQRLVIGAIAPLSSEQLALSAAANLRSIGLLAAHIISARVWWFHYVLKEGSPDLAPMVEWDEDYAPARGARELVAGLDSTWQVMRDGMARAGHPRISMPSSSARIDRKAPTHAAG